MNTAKVKPTWAALAGELQVNRGTVYGWRRKPGAPETPDLLEWIAFIEENGLGDGSSMSPEREELLAQKLKRQIALLDIKVARERRQIIPADEVDSLLGRIASGQRAELIQWCDTESPVIIAGGDLGEIRDNQRQMCDRLCDIMQGGIKRWLAEK